MNQCRKTYKPADDVSGWTTEVMTETYSVGLYKAVINQTKAQYSPEEFKKVLKTLILPQAKTDLSQEDYEQVERYASEQEKA